MRTATTESEDVRMTGRRDPRRVRPVPIAALIAAVLVMAITGCGSAGKADTKAPYRVSVEPQVRVLAGSATLIEKVLARVSSPNQLSATRRVVERQRDIVENARTALLGISPSAEDRPTHDALLEAAGAHRKFVVLLARVLSVKPRVGLDVLAQAQAAGTETIAGYRRFASLLPEAGSTSPQADLSDMSGLRTALRQQIALQEAAAKPPEPSPPVAPQPNVASLTLSDAQALTEQSYRMIKAGRPADGELLARRALTVLEGSGDRYEGNAFYNLGLSLLDRGRCRDALEPLSRALGTGNEKQNQVRVGTYSQAQACA